MPIDNQKANQMLGFFLCCYGKNGSSSWSCNVEAEFRLLSFKHQDVYVRKTRHLFHNDEYNWGFPSFITWEDVVNPDKGYIQNDSIRLEVHVKLAPQDLATGSEGIVGIGTF